MLIFIYLFSLAQKQWQIVTSYKYTQAGHLRLLTML